MTNIPTEAGVEDSILNWLANTGWEAYGADGNEGAAVLDKRYGRAPSEVIYWDLLRDWLVEKEVNEAITEDNVDDFLSSLRRDLAGDNLMETNQAFHEILRRGKSFTITDGEESRTIYVHLVDHEDRSNNSLIAANQFRVRRDGSVRPDIALFVNGIPTVVMELKSLAQDNDFYDAIKDLQRYETEERRLFVPVLFNVAADTMELRYGAAGAPPEYYMPWSEAPREFEDPTNPLKQTVQALCNPDTVLDILDNYVFYEKQPGRNAKIVPRYMQYYAVNSILDQIRDSDRKRGLIWHTQGSGKTFTMLFATRNLLERGLLPHPQVLIVVDTEDLEIQMERQLSRLNFSQYRVARSARHLQRLIERGESGLVLTTIQKFHDVEPDVQGNENTVILSDEAHRFMEKDLGSRLEAALPGAYHFGFTGTPVRERKRDTFANYFAGDGRNTFENYDEEDVKKPYLHRYSIREGIQDGVILPVHFDLRHVLHWDIDEAEIDVEFDREFAELSIEKRQEVIEEHVTRTELAQLRPRVKEIAETIDRHYADVEKNGWKAMVVTPTRRAAAIYGEELMKYRDPDEVEVLYTATADDEQLIRQFHTTPEERDAIVDRFKDRKENPRILVVCDMLLTGFDAPILKAMYLDRNLRDHNLLQAIARTNRPMDGKHNGLIVDFQGVFRNVDEALDYDEEVREHAARDVDELLDEIKDVCEDLLQLFEDIPRHDTQEVLNQCLALLSRDPKARRTFKRGYRRLQDLYETVSPDGRLVKQGIQEDYQWLTKVFVAFRRHNNRDDRPEEALREKTRELLAEHVDLKEIKQDFPIYKLDEDHLEKIEDISEPAARAASIIHATREHLQPRVDRNPRYRKISERLQEIVERWQTGAIQDPEAVERLERIEQEVLDLESEIEESAMDEAEFAVAALLEDCSDGHEISHEGARELASSVCTRFEEEVNTDFKGWRANPDTRRDARRAALLALVEEDRGDLAKDEDLLQGIIGYLLENVEGSR